ncbi:hypothetical protein [Pseudomonas aeruginosa]|uniref:hypothetical protein n=1 Tax=Pseudomonas aeruginosa TaxID=287 RepID=UPI00115D16DB|nr:hypothetical protein [Pseudomonas aeruginosa]ELG5196919.1 hypothetical protein [Pseudomonas aeruginosa]ELQ3329472.1 hypothetical protein [Pseudomonas aeruginosa]KAA5633727.1 hypothetical protein F3H11_00880 [Pseudomonas aeruginosa]KAA5647959.1 hypothetical protein F3G63_05365 [Pseudomonas aeruginosa]KAB5457966.1 hypothetical protein F8137_30285 [Pseudomonas aeruginosa]
MSKAKLAALKMAPQGVPFPFESLREIGLSGRTLGRIESYRKRHSRGDVLLLRWLDGVWCVVALAPSLLGPVLTTPQIADLYGEAKSAIDDGYLPLMRLRNW